MLAETWTLVEHSDVPTRYLSFTEILRLLVERRLPTLALFAGDSSLPDRYLATNGWDVNAMFRVDAIDLEQLLARGKTLRKLAVLDHDTDDDETKLIASMDPLTHLVINGGQISGLGVRSIASMPNLTFLDLEKNRLGDAGARALARLTALTDLHLSSNHIGDDGARALASLTSLTTLSLNSNQIGDDGVRALTSLRALTILWVRHNKIGDASARVLASMTELTALDLSQNEMTDEGVEALASLPRLKILNIAGNPIKSLPEGVQHDPTPPENLRGASSVQGVTEHAAQQCQAPRRRQ